MVNEVRTRIQGAFHGCSGSTIYRLESGHVVQQNRYRYEYRYTYRPAARLFQDGSGYVLDVDGMSETISVARVSLVEDGPIVSDFSGFHRDAVFQFQNGRIWMPAEYKYHYHYAHRPHASVVDGVNGYELGVEGMDVTIRVRRG
jgi:hypothetical protein